MRNQALVLSMLACICFGSFTVIAETQQENEAKARIHYLAGEKAFNNNNYRTAIIEWRKALKLKPDSKYTKQMLEKAEKKLKDQGEELPPNDNNAPNPSSDPQTATLPVASAADSNLPPVTSDTAKANAESKPSITVNGKPIGQYLKNRGNKYKVIYDKDLLPNELVITRAEANVLCESQIGIYHHPHCQHLIRRGETVKVVDAIRSGKKPCAHCRPPFGILVYIPDNPKDRSIRYAYYHREGCRGLQAVVSRTNDSGTVTIESSSEAEIVGNETRSRSVGVRADGSNEPNGVGATANQKDRFRAHTRDQTTITLTTKGVCVFRSDAIAAGYRECPRCLVDAEINR